MRKLRIFTPDFSSLKNQERRMKLNRHHAVAAIITAAVLPVRLANADQTKLDNAVNLDLGASWVSGTAPSTTDMAIWSGTYNTSANLSDAFTASTPVSWEGIRMGSISGTGAGLISIGGTGTAVTGSQLTLGTGGIDMSAANENLVINTKMTTINGNQTWNISSGHNLRLGTTGTGAANAIMNGSGNILITGGGVVDLNQGGSSGFADANSFATFTGTWTINTGATLRGIRNGATAFGNNTSANAITLAGGTLADGGISGDSGSWTWNTNITLASGTTSAIDEQIPSTISGGRYLKLNGNFTGSATANLVFKDTDATTTFSNSNYGYILTGTNTMSAGSTITIGGPVENGISGRLSYVRVGGNDGASGTDLTTTAGPGGSLGAASVVDNGILTFSYNNAETISN
jgi:fibronectin-binding autotransporter adhesin